MKIGILTICTGKYTIFFDSLYDSLEKHFLKGHEKTYYVFTDGEIREEDNVVRIEQNKLGWPYDTMMRFNMFNSISKDLSNENFLYFFNANMKAMNDIGDEVIPSENNDFLMGAHHPGFFGKSNLIFPYDRNPESSCYIPRGEGNVYVQGCFNGGRTKEFLEMSKLLANNTDTDIKNNIIPLWHDESEINWYYKDKSPLVLPYDYIYPEGWGSDINKMKMIQLDKNNHGKHNYLRS
tara:strand:- start:7784 stop:8491 length:708 start_codon:yes stop_codon:yes gene_type:complete